MKYRIMVPGSNSVYVKNYEDAVKQAHDVMRLNGFGYIYTIGGGPSRLIARFEPYYGIVNA